ncbi:MAG: ABC transporter permease [Paludibacteraceae bacterium]|nr:ABC transporter permease [Paludibacteraceae bacterium]
MNILSEIWSSISNNRFRTAMTGFAVAWGIFILVVLLGASNGLQNGIQDSYGSKVGNAVDIRAGWASKPYNGLPKDRSMFFTPREVHIIKQLPFVELFSAVVNKNVTANLGSQYSAVRLLGIEGDYESIYRKTIIDGRFINDLDNKERSKVCVVDKRTCEELGSNDLVGKYLQLGGIQFLVVGICQNGDRWEGASVHIPLTTCMSIFATDQHINTMSLTVNQEANRRLTEQIPIIDPDRPARFRDTESPLERELRQLLAPPMQFAPDDRGAIWVRSQAERIEETGKVMSAIRLFVLIIGICTLISGAVGVSNIMLVSVRERTKEFGIRKAIGAPPRTILLTVVGESILITALFGYLGMFIGIGIMEIINKFLPAEADFPFRNPTVDIPVVVIATTILVAVGIIAGAIPAIRAMKIKPIEALNYEK